MAPKRFHRRPLPRPMRLARLAFAALLCAALAGCDLPTDPVPTNPYDPLFDGTRTATPPTLTLAPSAGATVTVRWEDPSSFESGYRVERRSSLSGSAFTIVASLPADATEFTETGITDSEERQYRITTLTAREGSSAPALLMLRRRRADVAVSGLGVVATGVTTTLFSADGTLAYVFSDAGTYVIDTVSGTVAGALLEAVAPVGTLGGARVAALRVRSTFGVEVGIYEGAAIQRVVTLSPSADAACPELIPATLVVAAGGEAFAGVCGQFGTASRTVAVWTGAGGTPARLIVAPGNLAVALDLSADGGRVAVTATAGSGRAISVFDARSGAALWSATDSRTAGVPLRFSPDGQQVLDAGPAEARLLAAATGAVLSTQRAAGSLGGTVAFSPGGQSVAVPTGQIGTVVVMRLPDLAVTNLIRDTRAQGFRLLAADVVVGLRISEDARTYTVSRWDPLAAWEVVSPAGR